MITKQGLVGNLRGCRAWEALETHYQTVRELHLRKLFADDPKRGERLCSRRWVSTSITRSIASPTKPSNSFCNWPTNAGSERGSMPCFAATRLISQKTARSYTSLCAHQREHRLSSMARTLYPRSMPCSTGWLLSPSACGVANGRVILGSAFATSSTSALGAQTWDP